MVTTRKTDLYFRAACERNGAIPLRLVAALRPLCLCGATSAGGKDAPQSTEIAEKCSQKQVLIEHDAKKPAASAVPLT